MTETSLSYSFDNLPHHVVLITGKHNKRHLFPLHCQRPVNVLFILAPLTLMMFFCCTSLTLCAQHNEIGGRKPFLQRSDTMFIGNTTNIHQQYADTLSFALPQEIVPHWSYRHLSLEMGLGTARDLYRDEGSSPLSYNGIATVPDWRLTLNLGTWNFSLLSQSTLGVYRDALKHGVAFDAAAINLLLNVRAMRQMEDKHLWLGVSLNDIFSLKYNVHHENASIGVTDFIALGLHLHANISCQQLQQVLFHRTHPSRCWLVGEICLLPISLVLRPGYTFIDNYTCANSLLATFGSNYNWHIRSFSGVSTDIGFQWHMRNLRRLSLTYQWTYLNSGTGGTGWKYQSAIHSLRFSFTFPLKELVRQTQSIAMKK